MLKEFLVVSVAGVEIIQERGETGGITGLHCRSAVSHGSLAAWHRGCCSAANSSQSAYSTETTDCTDGGCYLATRKLAASHPDPRQN